MSLKIVAVLAAVVAVASAGHVPGLSYAAAVAPTYSFAAHAPAPAVPAIPIAPVAQLPPVVTTSYGYATKALGVPSVSYNVAPTPIATGYALGGHYGTVPYALGNRYGTGFGLGGHYAAAPFAFGNGYPTGFGLGGHYGAVAPLAYGYARGYNGGYAGW